MKRAAIRTKEATHERIVEAAARAIRRSGYNGTGVADIMKDAGLTHGGFYAHFPSREAMLAEAADRAGSESVATMERIAATSPPASLSTGGSHPHTSALSSPSRRWSAHWCSRVPSTTRGFPTPCARQRS